MNMLLMVKKLTHTASINRVLKHLIIDQYFQRRCTSEKCTSVLFLEGFMNLNKNTKSKLTPPIQQLRHQNVTCVCVCVCS